MGAAGSRTLRHLLTATTAALALAAVVVVVFTTVTVYRLHVPLPYWDEWYTVPDFRAFAEGRYGLADLASQHNEHRLLVPRLFFFADERLFGLSGVLNLTVTLLLQLANAAILVGLMARRVAARLPRVLLAGFVLVVLFTLRQEQNFSNGFQLQFVGVFTAAALGGVAYGAALERLAEGRGRPWPFFALATLACAVATYTMANGVLAGVVLAGAALLWRAPWRVVAATLALSGLLAALFFHGYVPGGGSLPLSHALTHPLSYLRYLTAYLGNPIGETLRPAQALGTLGLALALAAAWRAARTRDAAGLALLTLAGFVLASAAATAYGRIALGSGQALDSRYATPSSLFWAAIVLFWFPVAARRRAALVPLGAVMAVLVAASCWFEATAEPALATRAAALRRVSDSLASGLYDAEAAGTYENTPPEDVAPQVPFLRRQRLGPFAAPEVAALGHPLATLGPVEESCAGSVAVHADPALGEGGVRLSGTLPPHVRAPRRIVVAEAGGRVVGFGSASLPGQPSRLWSGYAVAGPGAVLSAYGRLADGALCAIGDGSVGP